MTEGIRSLLVEAFGVLEVEAEDGVLSRLARYVDEMIRWNRRINLTGAAKPGDFVRGPLFDALSILPVYKEGETLVDVGAGGGLPGIPVAIVDGDCRVTLVEPRSKRVAFLNHVCHLLGLEAEVLPHRFEDLGRRQWRGAVAQAVWAPGDWLPRGMTLVAPGGIVYALSSRPLDPGSIPPGLRLEKEVETTRPFDGAQRFSSRLGLAQE